MRRQATQHHVRCALLIGAAWLGVGLGRASACGLGGGVDAMPDSFRIDDLTIRVTAQAGNAAYRPEVVTLRGNGRSSFERGASVRSLPWSAQQSIDVLNTLHAICFFELPIERSSFKVAQLGAEGGVNSLRKQVSDAQRGSVCVALPDFEKCVRYDATGPLDVAHIAEHVFAAAALSAGGR